MFWIQHLLTVNDGNSQRGAKYYPLNDKEFLIIVNDKIWKCQLIELEENE